MLATILSEIYGDPLFSDPVRVSSIGRNSIQVLLIRSDPVLGLTIRSGPVFDNPIRSGFCKCPFYRTALSTALNLPVTGSKGQLQNRLKRTLLGNSAKPRSNTANSKQQKWTSNRSHVNARPGRSTRKNNDRSA